MSASLGSLLAASWGRLGPSRGMSWTIWGLCRVSWGAREDVLGRLGVMFGASWAVRGGDFGGVSERLPGTSESMFPEAPPGTSCKAWTRDLLEASWGLLGGLPGASGKDLWGLWGLRETSSGIRAAAILGLSWGLSKSRWAPRKPPLGLDW